MSWKTPTPCMRYVSPLSRLARSESLTGSIQFGYGKSYSDFEYSDLTVSKSSAKSTDTVTVRVKVKNLSGRDGAEVVQVYVKDLLSSVVVPNIQLKGFSKVTIKAGETATVSVDLAVSEWGLWNGKMEYVVEPGDFTIFVGSSSRDLRLDTNVKVG